MDRVVRFRCLLPVLLLFPPCATASFPFGNKGDVRRSSNCKSLLWFTSLSLHWDEESQEATKDYIDYLEVALMSALRNAPSLRPVLLYDGPPNMLTAWFENMGGLVVFHYLSIYDELRQAEAHGQIGKGHADFVRGTYLRLDIPILLPKILEKFGDAVESQYYLYSDCDVMFLQDIDGCTLQGPEVMLAGPEFHKGKIGNVGVLYVNAEAMAKDTPGLLAYGREKHWNFESADQTLLLTYFKDRIELLPDEFNWKGYWGSGRDISVVHWHGPKPMRCLPCYLLFPSHYKEECAGPCGGLVNVMAAFCKDEGRFYKQLMQIWYRLRVEVKASQRKGTAQGGNDLEI